MANRSRVKTDEEYNSMIESKIDDKDLKVTRDASRYFDELRDLHSESEDNPFEKKVSMEDLKTSIKHSNDFVDVDQIKEEIAKMQVETKPEATIPPLDKTRDSEARRFSFEENARKLYENLRESKVTPYYDKEVVIEPIKEASEDVKIVEPVSIIKEEIEILEEKETLQPVEDNVVVEAMEITNDTPIIEEPIEIETVTPIVEEIPEMDLVQFDKDIIKEKEVEIEELDLSELELTADFTKENENFLEAVGIEKEARAQLPQEPLFDAETELEEVEELVSDEDIDDFDELEKFLEANKVEEPLEEFNTFHGDDELINILSDQEEQVDYNTLVNEKDLMDQINEIKDEPRLEDELVGLSKKPKNSGLSDTLTMALDNEKSISFSPTEIKELTEEDFKDDEVPPKRKIGDTIITILLVVMIIVVAYLAFRMITNS